MFVLAFRSHKDDHEPEPRSRITPLLESGLEKNRTPPLARTVNSLAVEELMFVPLTSAHTKLPRCMARAPSPAANDNHQKNAQLCDYLMINFSHHCAFF